MRIDIKCEYCDKEATLELEHEGCCTKRVCEAHGKEFWQKRLENILGDKLNDHSRQYA